MGSQKLDIRRVGVVGGGTMGSGIAEVCARSGLDTTVVEIDAAAVEQVQRRIAASLGKAQARGRITTEAHDAATANLSYSHDLAELADRDLVIEAVIEHLPEKRRIFGLLDTITSPHAVLASNTSSIAIIDLATATKRPQRVVGMHFFNPPRCSRSWRWSVRWPPTSRWSTPWWPSAPRCWASTSSAARTGPGLS